METRRKFLKYAGVSLLGLAAAPVSRAAASYIPHESHTKSRAEALTGSRWAMVIDTRKLTRESDFKPLIEACHSVHNVPDIEPPLDIKWIWTDKKEHVFPGKHNEFQAEKIEHKPYLLLCNHCHNPPCVRVCPTQATFKRESDGIVVMDMHRCIGCRYCMAACPYGARSFNFMDPSPHIKELNREYPERMRGVVEKCNFCVERLAEGKMPACVEASDGALIFGDLDDPYSEVRKVLRKEYTIRRKPGLGTEPNVYYII
ncbi:sulfate reduction electron transfer complex DsrMKJOP subunit DsrO [Desulfohalovibrio reitneri]|uniref:sulfate reduction electron transfer complex DsrMKJOP subunit DsrO n=1 Tax=Desulfohalovibrio reitneri TaxID=1307759 RepID=UPI0004A75CAD|nr:4Fe-4S dicluster domain-containing protein [Desulfohalovibrio reitneri]